MVGLAGWVLVEALWEDGSGVGGCKSTPIRGGIGYKATLLGRFREMFEAFLRLFCDFSVSVSCWCIHLGGFGWLDDFFAGG